MLRTNQVVYVQQSAPEVEVRGGIAGVVGERGFVAGDRLLPPVALLKQVPEAVVGDRDGRMAAEQAAVPVDGQVAAAALARHRGEQMQRIGLIGNRVEHPTGKLLRLAEVPGTVCVEGASQPPIETGVGAGLSRAAR